MLTPRAVVAVVLAGLTAACGSGQSTDAHADISKIATLKSSFGAQFKVTDIPKTGIDPKLLAGQKVPNGTQFVPADCANFVTSQAVPPGSKGNMAAVTAEGDGNRFIVIAVETSEPIPVSEPGSNCAKVSFAGGTVRGTVEVTDVPAIDGSTTLGVHRVLQTTANGKTQTGEVYNLSAHFGDYQVLVTANPLVLPDKPPVPVNIERARDLLVAGVAAIRQ